MLEGEAVCVSTVVFMSQLDLIGFDACLMANLESFLPFASVADKMIASEELEPGSGWDYTFLSNVDANTTPTYAPKPYLHHYIVILCLYRFYLFYQVSLSSA